MFDINPSPPPSPERSPSTSESLHGPSQRIVLYLTYRSNINECRKLVTALLPSRAVGEGDPRAWDSRKPEILIEILRHMASIIYLSVSAPSSTRKLERC